MHDRYKRTVTPMLVFRLAVLGIQLGSRLLSLKQGHDVGYIKGARNMTPSRKAMNGVAIATILTGLGGITNELLARKRERNGENPPTYGPAKAELEEHVFIIGSYFGALPVQLRELWTGKSLFRKWPLSPAGKAINVVGLASSTLTAASSARALYQRRAEWLPPILYELQYLRQTLPLPKRLKGKSTGLS